jgi:3-isopropylmalate/(R)-2-methylmalate dehydratase small subunit
MSRARVVLALDDDVSTDQIYPGRYMATVLPAETPQFAFADQAAFNALLKSGGVPAGSVIVAGKNFGCGSSREQAVSTLKGHELAIAAKSFARIFLQNAINLGLKLVEVPDLVAAEGDDLAIGQTELTNLTTGRRFGIKPLPAARQAIMDAGGLIPYTRQRLTGRGAAT